MSKIEDPILKTIVDFAVATDTESVPKNSWAALIRHHLDAVGCALGGFDGEPCALVRKLAGTGTAVHGASVIGLPELSTPEYAALANATMVRYLDYNDTYEATDSGGHPSDLIPALWAAAETHGSSGRDLILAIHIAYEVFAVLADEAPLHDHGIDSALNLEIAGATAAGKLLQLTPDQIASAISMAITPTIPMRVTRSSDLAHWKALSRAYGAMTAIQTARFAQIGLLGPRAPFGGPYGLMSITGRFSLDQLGRPKEGRSAIERTQYKLFPCNYHAQAPMQAMADLHRDGVVADDIQSISIRTYEGAWRELGGGHDDHDEKWNPQTKATATRSMPYIVALGLIDGRINSRSFSLERIQDPTIRSVMQKITVINDSELGKNSSHHIDIALRGGAHRQVDAKWAPGHYLNPPNDEQLATKFADNCSDVLDMSRANQLLELLWNLDSLTDIRDLMLMLRAAGPQ